MSAPKFQVVSGFNFYPEFPAADALTYEARPDDLFIVTYPKNGSTWTQYIVSLILNDGIMPAAYEEGGIWAVSPFLEAGRQWVEEARRPCAIKTHLPFHLQPKHPTAKYIVVLRNPKDACVSFYFHQKMIPGYGVSDMDFHTFFPFWMRGEVESGDYFDFVLSWWDRRDDANVLILFYEEMKEDIEREVLKIGRFLGHEYVDKLSADNQRLLDLVIEKSSFDAIKDKMNSTFTGAKAGGGVDVADDERRFARKGIVGDWKNHLTEEESRLVDHKFDQRLQGTGLGDVWRRCGIFPPL